MTRLIIGLAGMAVVSSPVTAQEAVRDDIMQVIAAMFEGLAQRDTARMGATLEPGARLVQTTTNPDGIPQVTVVDMPDFLAAVGRTDGPKIEERYWNPQVVVHDNLATVWISYVFLVEGQISHCGEDTFQLARATDGWKIIALADTQRRQGCEDRSGSP